MWSFFSRDPAKDFAYEIGETVSGLEDRSLWILHQGKRKVSVRHVYVGVAWSEDTCPFPWFIVMLDN